jgi:hypothetical protein
MGKSFGGVWIGVYNTDPQSDRRYELAVTVRTKASVATTGQRRSSFGGPPRPR